MRRQATLLLLLLGALAGGGCRSILGSEELRDLAAAERRWSREGPASYSYVLQRSCFCLMEAVAPVRITVHDGVVVNRVYVGDGTPVSQQFAAEFPAMEGLFAIIRDAVQRADHVDGRYDAQFGYPIRVRIDYLRNAVDDELTLEAGDVRPL